MNRQFPALRGLAIVVVVFFHSIQMVVGVPQDFGYPPIGGWSGTLLLVLRQIGVFAVPTFMFISGSFFAYAAQARGKEAKLPYKVSWTNIKHILWPYLIWSSAFYVAIYFGRGEAYTIPGYIKNLIVGYPYHFIPILIFYYAMAPIIVLFGKRFGWILLVIVALYQVFLRNVVFNEFPSLTLPHWMDYLVIPVLGRTMAEWAIFFPMGVIYGLNMRKVLPELQKLKWLFFVLTFTLFVLTVLVAISYIHLPWAPILCPVAFLLFIPTIKRQSIPMVRSFERIGQGVYGIYLTHLLVLYLALLIINSVAPTLFNFRILLLPFLFALALGLPLVVMNGFTRSSAKIIYPYVFG